MTTNQHPQRVFRAAYRNGSRVQKPMPREDWLKLFRFGDATVHDGKCAVRKSAANAVPEIWEYVNVTD